MLTKEHINIYSKDFWKYASKSVGINNVEDVFMDWAKQACINFGEFKGIWKIINADIDKAFSLDRTKEALTFKSIDELSQLIDLVGKKKEVNIPITPEEEEAAAEAENLLEGTADSEVALEEDPIELKGDVGAIEGEDELSNITPSDESSKFHAGNEKQNLTGLLSNLFNE